MSKQRLDHAAAKRRDQAIAAARQERAAAALRPSAVAGYMPATDKQRIYLAELHAELGWPNPNLVGLTKTSARTLIGKALAAKALSTSGSPCPVCDAAPGEHCRNRRGEVRRYHHTERSGRPRPGRRSKARRSTP